MRFDRGAREAPLAVRAALREIEPGMAVAPVLRLGEGRTVISVTHRLASVRTADRIFVFSAGRIVESGAHLQLMAAGGPYAQLWARHLLVSGCFNDCKFPQAIENTRDSAELRTSIYQLNNRNLLPLATIHYHFARVHSAYDEGCHVADVPR